LPPSVPKPVVLCILDGWGLSPRDRRQRAALARTPNFDRLMATCPHATLITHGPDVGLPRGQMGNSEVGHMNIGAGRVVAMDLGQIDLAIEDGSFSATPPLAAFIDALKAMRRHRASDGRRLGWRGARPSRPCRGRRPGDGDRGRAGGGLHAITDGRDVAPDSAGHLARADAALPRARIATVIGRYWAMDRDNRWDRVEKAYAAMPGRGRHRRPMPGGGRRGLCARRDRRIHRAHGDRRLQRPAAGRRAVLPQLPRRPRARDPAASARRTFDGIRRGPRPCWPRAGHGRPIPTIWTAS
jgi:hypothetical protein